MKTSFRQTFDTGTIKLKPSRPRLNAPGRFRASRRSTITEPAERVPETLSAETDAAPTEARSADALQLYLREIGQVKLLTPDEEITLAGRIKRGDAHAR